MICPARPHTSPSTELSFSSGFPLELSLSLSALIIFKQLYTLCSSLLATPKPGLTSLGKTRDKAHHLKDIRSDNLIRAHKVLK